MIKDGKIWPIAIGLSFIFIVALIVGTIKVSLDYPVEKSREYMRDYHDADKNANEIIASDIEFKKRYNVEFLTKEIRVDSTLISFKVSTKDGQSVDNAKIDVIFTRPDMHKYNVELNNPTYNDGVYSFESVTLPKEGRWNVISKISIGEYTTYVNVRADTRESEFKIY